MTGCARREARGGTTSRARSHGLLVAATVLAGLLGPAALAQVRLEPFTPLAPAETIDPIRSAALTGLEWTFARIRYSTPPDRLAQFRRTYWSDPWAIPRPPWAYAPRPGTAYGAWRPGGTGA